MAQQQNRFNVSLSKEVGVMLGDLQDELTHKLGFQPSMSQVVEHLLNAYFKSTDKLTKSQNVATRSSNHG